MARPISGQRIAKARRGSVTAEETVEIDFQLGLRQAVEIFAVEFDIGEISFALSGDGIIDENIAMSLHMETGALENTMGDAAVDEQLLNSEVLAEAAIQVAGQDTAASTGGSAYSVTWTGPMVTNFLQIYGVGFLTAQNLTFRVVPTAASVQITVINAQVRIYYRYVELTNEELVRQFALRR